MQRSSHPGSSRDGRESAQREQATRRDHWRTREIEEGSNLYLIHPASAMATAWFARRGWTPNQVSALGMLSALIASWCFYHYQSSAMVLLGLVLMLGWHIMDGADGQLARLTGQTSEAGKVIDGLCDHLGFGMVYVSLSMALQQEYGAWIWLLALGAGLSHAVQASALEFQRDCYDCWVHRKTGKCAVPLSRHDTDHSGGASAGLFGKMHHLYIRLQHRVSEADEALISGEEHLRDHPHREEIGQVYRDHALAAVHLWTWLSANKRTIAVTIFCLVKLPILFFLYEIIVLNGLLLWLKRNQRRTNRKFLKALLRYVDRTDNALST